MDWRHRAVCRDEDPDLFFPIGNDGPARHQIAEAKTVCNRCPVVSDCQDQHAAAVRELEKFRADHTEVAAAEFESMARDLYRRADNLPLSNDSQTQRLGDFREIADKLMARADALRGAR